MNNQEFNTSKPVSEEVSQEGSTEAESPVTGSEPRQRSSSSRSENLDQPSFSSSDDRYGLVGNNTDETSSVDKPESISPTAISLSVPDIKYRLNGLIKLLFADEQRTFLRVLLASSLRIIGEQIVFVWEESDIGQDLYCKFWLAARNRSPLVITHLERIFLEEFSRRPPYGIPTAIVNLFNFTDSPLLAPRPSGQSIEALEMALARISLRKFAGLVMYEARYGTYKEISRTCESNASSELLHSQTLSSGFQICMGRYVTIIRSLYEIPRRSESDAFSKLCESQPSPSASQNGVHESQIELKQIESGEDCYDTGSWASEDTLKDGSPNETQSPEMELKSEMNANDPNLDEDSSAPETLDRECANPLQETPDLPSEESSEESPEGTPAKKPKHDLK